MNSFQNKNWKQTVESAQNGLEIIFNLGSMRRCFATSAVTHLDIHICGMMFAWATFKRVIFGGSFCAQPPWILSAWLVRGPEGANALKMNPLLESHHLNHNFSWLSSVSPDMNFNNCFS